ncbi:protein kinase domain-containing protein [Streptomyces ziwulingensis]|uniref:non-specific serine/threonine protein kinase n=1 Tax=Streptomyces ziwulingensis TaxID=1045501 RepID=A0ABP9CIU7_9ACTN
MQLPHHIGRYRLEEPLGSGAFGVVWKAHDDSLQAPVAVKVMADNWARRLDLRERFLSEARLLRQAASPRVVQVYDIGELSDERPYFVMEYADGGTLEDLVAEGPLPVAEGLRLAAEAARAVAVLHEAGIVHRDVKPSNMLIRSESGGRPGRLLVADLGLAKSLAHASGLTMTAGSAGYMAPEQADPVEGIDERADVYGLGALTYYLLTGAVPAAPGKVVPPGRVRDGLPDRVERVVLRALKPDRERRWPTAAAFADALEDAAGRTAADPGRRGTPRRTAVGAAAGRRRGARRKRILLGSAAAVVATGCLAGWFALDDAGRDVTTALPPAGHGTRPHAAATPSATVSATAAGPTSAAPGTSPAATPASSAPAAPASTGTGTVRAGTGAASASPSTATVSAEPEWTTMCVQPNERLRAGGVWSTNRTRMVMEAGGDLVIYDEDGRARWSSGTTGSGNEAYLQGDGNLVVFAPDGRSLWHTGTQDHDGAILCLGADGNVNLVYQDQAIWSAHTGH